MIRCMGGARCDHAAGTCTATKGDTPILPDWVLLEAVKRWGGFIPEHDRDYYARHDGYRALCDMILKHEQPPIDRKLLCAEQAAKERDLYGYGRPIDVAVRAIELWEEGFGK